MSAPYQKKQYVAKLLSAIESLANPCDAHGGRWELEPGRVVDITKMTASVVHDAISLMPQYQLR